MFDVRYKIVKDDTNRSEIYIIWSVFKIFGIAAGCSAQNSPENYFSAQAAQNDDYLSLRYLHRRQNYPWEIKIGISTFCFAVMDVNFQLDMVWAQLIIDTMQFKKICSFSPRHTYESTLRSLIILGLEWEKPIVSVSHGHSSHLLNRMDALPWKYGAFRSTQLNSNQFLFKELLSIMNRGIVKYSNIQLIIQLTIPQISTAQNF